MVGAVVAACEDIAKARENATVVRLNFMSVVIHRFVHEKGTGEFRKQNLFARKDVVFSETSRTVVRINEFFDKDGHGLGVAS
jgi:hypothetical protein